MKNKYAKIDALFSNESLRPCEEAVLREREFMENLVQARFNFFVVLWGVIVVYSLTASNTSQACIICCAGTVSCTAIAFTIYRAHDKLDNLLRALRHYPDNAARLIGLHTDDVGISFKAIYLIGYLIPAGCCIWLLLLSGAFVHSVSHDRTPLWPYWGLVSLPIAIILGIVDVVIDKYYRPPLLKPAPRSVERSND